MCEALEKVSEHSWNEVADRIAKIEEVQQAQVAKQIATDKTLSKWTGIVIGVMALVGLVMTGGMWVLNRSVTRNDKAMEDLSLSVRSFTTELAVFRQEVKPFITAGPRFTSKDYEQRIRADLSDFRDSLPPPEVKQKMKNIEERLDHKKELIQALERRIEVLEHKENP